MDVSTSELGINSIQTVKQDEKITSESGMLTGQEILPKDEFLIKVKDQFARKYCDSVLTRFFGSTEVYNRDFDSSVADDEGAGRTIVQRLTRNGSMYAETGDKFHPTESISVILKNDNSFFTLLLDGRYSSILIREYSSMDDVYNIKPISECNIVAAIQGDHKTSDFSFAIRRGNFFGSISVVPINEVEFGRLFGRSIPEDAQENIRPLAEARYVNAGEAYAQTQKILDQLEQAKEVGFRIRGQAVIWELDTPDGDPNAVHPFDPDKKSGENPQKPIRTINES